MSVGIRHPAVTVCSSGRAGRVLALVGGVHGDEFYGPALVVAVAKRLRQIAIRGEVILVADANPFAVDERARSSKTVCGDLNRQFGDKPAPADAILRSTAQELWNRHLSRADVLVDVHSGGEHRMLPHARFTGDPADVLSIVGAMGIDYAMRYRSLPPGLLISKSRGAGAAAVGIEIGGGHELNPDILKMMLEGVWGLLGYLGIVAGLQVRSRTPTVVAPGEKLRASAPGLFLPSVDAGQAVEQGDIVGEFTTFTSLRTRSVRARTSGTVFSILMGGPAGLGAKLIEIVPHS